MSADARALGLEVIATPAFPEGSKSWVGHAVAVSGPEDGNGFEMQFVVLAMNADWAAVAGELLTGNSMDLGEIKPCVLTLAPWVGRRR